MDRGHRAFLSLAGGAVIASLAAGVSSAQSTPVPQGSPTPWVQAPPAVDKTAPEAVPPVPAPTPKPVAIPAAGPTASPTPTSKPVTTPAPPPKAAASLEPPAPKPTATPRPPGPNVPAASDDAKAKVLRERQRAMEQAREQEELSPDERTTFQNNLRMWRELPPEDRQALREQAGGRIREETQEAYVQSGLVLNDDQREVFALRYKQERRRLERELQEKARGERSRRLPQILEGLKREFGKMPTAPGTPKPAPSPGPNPTASPAVSPAPGASATPSPTKAP